MRIGQVHEMEARLAVSGPRAGAAAGFAEKLSGAMTAPRRRGPQGPWGQARQAAEQLVATTLVQPLLQQMRNDPLRSDLMHGGLTEDAFGAQLDTELADRIVRRAHWPIVERIVDTVTRRLQGGGTAVEVRA